MAHTATFEDKSVGFSYCMQCGYPFEYKKTEHQTMPALCPVCTECADKTPEYIRPCSCPKEAHDDLKCKFCFTPVCAKRKVVVIRPHIDIAYGWYHCCFECHRKGLANRYPIQMIHG